MEFNYNLLGNQNVQSVLPLFGNVTNGAANTSPYLTQLMAAMQGGGTKTSASTPPTTTSSTTNTSHYGPRKRRSKTPEPPPAPRFNNSENRKKSGQNQGAQPMDLENDGDADVINIDADKMTSGSGNGKSTQQHQQLHKQATTTTDSSLLLNAILNGSVNPSAASYMFFPTATGSMLMDPSTMMAAALQQLHGFNSYMPTGAEGAAVAMPTEAQGGGEAQVNSYGDQPLKELIKTKHCTLFPPNPNAPAPTIRERPPGCRTVFVGGLPEFTTEEIIREIFDSCGEITTLRMSKKNFCHIRFRNETSVDRAIYLSGYRIRISSTNDPTNFGRLHVDYAQARDDQYDYECKQRQLQREQRHRDRSSLERRRSQSPPPTPHYSDHEASAVSESLRNNDSFIKGVQTITVWLERGDCSKKNANMFYSMIQSTHAHVRRLHTDKQQLEEDLKKARECYRKQMLAMSQQFTQIEKVFNAASHKKVWDHFSKAQRKNIDQWKKLASELRSVQIEDDEMEMSDEDRDLSTGGARAKRSRYDNDHLKYENDSLRCQVEAMRSELSLERTDTKYNSDFREKQIKVLQETIRNMQTQLMMIKSKEQKDQKTIEQLERKLKESGVKQLLLKTKIRETTEKLKTREGSLETSEVSVENSKSAEAANNEQKTDGEENKTDESELSAEGRKISTEEPEAIDLDNIPDEVVIVENECDVVEIADCDDVQIVDAEKENEMEEEEEEKEKQQATAEEQPEVESKETEDATIATVEQNAQSEIKTAESAEQDHTNQLKLLAEARIIALVTAYLVVHPLGVSCDSIFNYLSEIIKPCHLDAIALADILNKYTNIFQATPKREEELTSEVIIKWKFCGYKTERSVEDSKEEA